MTVARPHWWEVILPSGGIAGTYSSKEKADAALRELVTNIRPGMPMAGTFMVVEKWEGWPRADA